MRRNWSVTATIIATLFILLANVSGWSTCRPFYYIAASSGCPKECCESDYRYYKTQHVTCSSGPSVTQNFQTKCIFYSGDVEQNCGNPYNGCTMYSHCVKCDTQTEADSIACINQGNQWIGGQCKTPSCTPSDTSWLKTSISACQDIRGSNNYALVDTNDVCEHRGHCCALDSLIDGEGCKWRCESQDSLCALNKGNFSYAIVADTAVSGSDTTYTGLCYNNCFMHASKDSLTGIVTGNVTAVDNTSMGVGTYYPDGFKGIRSDYGGIYTYDFLSDENYEWADSLLSAPCSVGMYRGIKNGKYVYWKSGQPVPEGVTNVVKVK